MVSSRVFVLSLVRVGIARIRSYPGVVFRFQFGLRVVGFGSRLGSGSLILKGVGLVRIWFLVLGSCVRVSSLNPN